MRIKPVYRAAALFGMGLMFSTAVMAGPSGAKALFDSGRGTTIGMSVGQEAVPVAKSEASAPVRTAVAPRKEKYVGISYQLMVISDDGQMRAVSRHRTFRTDERVKIIARTNRPGYLTVLNRGTSGQTHVLYHEYVDGFSFVDIPKNNNLRFVGAPGKEDIVLMLSDYPNPIAIQAGLSPSGSPAPAPAPAADYSASAPAPNYGSYTPPADSGNSYTPPSDAASNYSSAPAADSGQSYGSAVMASLDGAKSLHGAKDLVMEDKMESTYAVVSPKHGYKAAPGGMKDLVLESSEGTNYGVVPVSAVSDGGILTLKIGLRHR
jgi:hypothetical protein